MSWSRKSDRLRSAPPTSEYQKKAVGTKSMNQVTPRKEYAQQRSPPYQDACDNDSLPYNSSCEEHSFSSSGPTPPGTIAQDIASRRHNTITPTSSATQPRPQTQVTSKHVRGESDSRRRTGATTESPSFLAKVGGFFSRSTGLPSTNSDLDLEIIAKEEEIGRLRAALCEKENYIEQISKGYEREAEHRERKHETLLEDEKRKSELSGKQLKSHKMKNEGERDETIRSLQAEVHEIKSDRDLIEAKYTTFVRQQQEEAFQQMESARWLPPEESKVLGNFERIKRDMKSWAKGTAIKDMSLIEEFGENSVTNLMSCLSAVGFLQENQLPQGLSTRRAPALLLNALLAHDVYTNLFRNPFFFLKDEPGDDVSRAGPEQTLHRIYLMAQDSDQRDAHMWRSQTLRLLLPPLRNDSRDGEKALRSCTEGVIARVSNQHASNFLASPARFLINNDAIANTTKKLKTIYREAANISYMLWTRRTTMECITLQDMGRPTFDAKNPHLVPHNLVHPDDYEDKLKGVPITVVVHPLLKVYGTDEGKDYDNGRVWVPAEVWLDSK